MRDEMKGSPAITPRRMAEFQRFVFKLSSVFLAIPAVEIPAAIERSLRETAEFWDFSQVFLVELIDEGRKLTTIYSYMVEGGVPVPPGTEVANVPWLMGVLRSGQPKAMSRVLDEVPLEETLDRQEVERLSIKSALILPFIVGGKVQGGLFFNNVRKHREYPDELILEFRHLGQILAGALERLKAYRHIEHSRRFDKLLSEMSARYINLPSSEIEQCINDDLGRLGRFLAVDRCIFYQTGAKPGTYHIDDLFNWWIKEDTEKIRKLQAWVRNNPDFISGYQYCFNLWNRGEVVQYGRIEELPPEAAELRSIHERFSNRSWFSVPVSMGGENVGALAVATTKSYRVWPQDLGSRLRLFGEIFANAIRRKEQDDSLRKALREIRGLKKQIEADFVYLQDELTLEHNYEEIIGQSEGLRSVLVKVEQVAPTDVTTLIMGETGTGKELIARAIHYRSKRIARPLIKVNCAALAPNLIESELFGHERGAFTGADKRRIGRFELANGASLFLDEIGELPLELQPKLLRVLQEGEFERIGGCQTIKVDVRIIAATNRNLEQLVEEGKFRSDLWYRLNSFPIFLPPLRERQEDIPLFISHFVNQYCSKVGKCFDKIPRKVIEQLRRYSWPGNVREMDNIISRAVIISEEGNLQVQLPPSPQAESESDHQTYREMQRSFILRSLKEVGWKIEGVAGAAKRLDLNPSTLRNKMKKLNIQRPE
ncbi:MAG: sigma 54-interacting transcriptional regulator [Desulfopila sp.]